jgi:hypothetical protein
MEIRLNLDAKKRINLTKLLPNVDIHSVKAYKEDNKIIIELMAEIPACELWLHQNPEALKSVQRGLKQSSEGKVKRRTSFAEYADDEI